MEHWEMGPENQMSHQRSDRHTAARYSLVFPPMETVRERTISGFRMNSRPRQAAARCVWPEPVFYTG